METFLNISLALMSLAVALFFFISSFYIFTIGRELKKISNTINDLLDNIDRYFKKPFLAVKEIFDSLSSIVNFLSKRKKRKRPYQEEDFEE